MSRYHLASASATPRPPAGKLRQADGLTQSPGGPWFRGTRDGNLKPNAHGIVWLAPDQETALSYGPRVLEVRLYPSASIIDLQDLSHPAVRAVKETVSSSREMNLGHPIPDGNWPAWADFGMLEGNLWTVPLLLENGVDGVVVSDYRGTAAVTPHDSLALLDMSTVSSWEEVTD